MSFTTYLLSTFYVLGTSLDFKKQNKVSASKKFVLVYEEIDNGKIK